MKREFINRKYKWLYVIDFILVILIFVVIVYSKDIEPIENSITTSNELLTTYLSSNYLEKDIEFEEIITEEKVEEKEIIKTETKENNSNSNSSSSNDTNTSSSEKSQTKTEVENKTVEKTEKVLETLNGSLAGYGPDCYGCTSFRTASGRDISDGKIYYEDEEYGTIRIVAGDKSYPFGTIVKMTNTGYYDNSPIYAIVLDRGGGVGKGKQFLFDLLFSTEKEALKMGSKKNVTFEILRLGY